MASKIPIIGKCFRKNEYQLVHECELPLKEDILVNYIEAGWFIMLRRKWKNLLLVSATSPRSKIFLKSSEAIRDEKARHLQHYYWVIHPFSTGRAYWECWMLFVFLVSLFLIPVQLSLSKYYQEVNSVRLIIDCFCLLDVGINFCTGYYNVNTKRIILSPKQIARHYILGFFLIDFITSVPFYMFVDDEHVQAIKLVAYLKFLRIITCVRYMDRLKERKNYSGFVVKIVKFILIFSLIVLWMSSICFVHLQSSGFSAIFTPHLDLTSEELLFALTYSYFRACYCLLLVGNSDVPTEETLGIYLQAIGLQVGMFVQLFVLANVIQILGKYHTSGSKYQQLIQELEEYARYKNLPDKMRNRLVEYFEFRYQKHFYREHEIYSTISPQLREEISVYTCKKIVEKMDYFKDLPEELLISVVVCLKPIFYLPNDVIIQSGSEGDSMFFISFGTVAVYGSTGVEICHLADGGHFGEVALVLDEIRIATVVAVDPCEVYRLSKVDFKNLFEEYPEYVENIKRLAAERQEETNVMEEKRISEIASIERANKPPRKR